MAYAKLFSNIVASSLWSEDDKTRIVFITMLAMADWEGVVEASPAGLAPLARVSLKDCKSALHKLMSPDPESKNPDHEGRRVAKIEGGFLILNYTKFREKRSKEFERGKARERQRKHRAKKALSHNVTPCHAMSLHTDTDTETETDKELLVSYVSKKRTLKTPTLEEVKDYVKLRKLHIDPERFFNYFNDAGWVDMYGNEVRCWKQKALGWERREPSVQEDNRLRRLVEDSR
ncbi:MAG: hypothetical protein ACYSTZ_00235 [Planctomycetota bacterium]|jgi:hypothetical protein